MADDRHGDEGICRRAHKHHAKCETEEDPHSPQTRGIKALLLTGVELYRAEAKNPETLAKYGKGTPDDWIERNLYTRYSWQGVGLMLIIDLLLFGAIGLTIWAIQMAWIPVWATGVINGIGHWWGYRNFEAADASTNVSPWGILIGGEELHNNHHTYPTSAKFSVKPFEFDIGWGYIRAFEMLGWAKVRKTVPKLRQGDIKPADKHTLEVIIANRYELMASYGRGLKAACGEELHNNHHTYPTSAKFSVKPYEFDIGWVYISLLSRLGLARAKKTPPRLAYGDVRPVADDKTLEALIAHRYEVMASYARHMRAVFRQQTEAAGGAPSKALQAARRWLHRDADKVPAAAVPQLAEARAAYPVLDQMVTMREELRQLWLNTGRTREQLVADLQAWCKRAEDSGIAALREFSLKLRAVRSAA